jgi:hypothetical protein
VNATMSTTNDGVLLELRVNGGVVVTPTAHASPFHPRESRGRENGKRGGRIGCGIKETRVRGTSANTHRTLNTGGIWL